MEFRKFTRPDWWAYSGCEAAENGLYPAIAEVGEAAVVIDATAALVHLESGPVFALERAELPGGAGIPELTALLAEVPFTADPGAVGAALAALGFTQVA